MRSVNRVVLTGGLTRDPELRRTPSGAAVATLRVGYTTQYRASGEWRERSNYVDVEVFGGQAQSTARHLRKGRQIAVDGRLEWREWETRGGERRQTHAVVADTVEFLPDGRASAPGREPAGDEPVVDAVPQEEDVPF